MDLQQQALSKPHQPRDGLWYIPKSTFQVTCMTRSKAYHKSHDGRTRMTSSGASHGAGLPQPLPGKHLAFTFPLVWEAAGNSQGCRDGARAGSGSTVSLALAHTARNKPEEVAGDTQHQEVSILSLGESSLEVNSVFGTAAAPGRAFFLRIRLSRQRS